MLGKCPGGRGGGMGGETGWVENVRRREISRKGSACQNAILWTPLFTPKARAVTIWAQRAPCLLHEGKPKGRQTERQKPSNLPMPSKLVTPA